MKNYPTIRFKDATFKLHYIRYVLIVKGIVHVKPFSDLSAV